MSRKHYRFKRLPPCNRFLDVSLSEENAKLWEEMIELQEMYAKIQRKIDLGQKVTLQDVTSWYLEAFDVAQVATNTMYLIQKQYGKHYCFTVDDIIRQGIAKNRVRGYYDEVKK